VSPAANDVAPVIEEAATLFANGQAEQALATLLRSVREADLGASTLQAWLMLFDLHQHLGMKGEFEALALEFVVKFERSPPAWIESEGRTDRALATGGIGYCALVGTLSEASAPELEKLRKAAGTQDSVRVDCSELQGVDSAGCGLLHEALLSLGCAGTEIMLTGEARLIEPLEQACQPGRIETDGALWALLLDVYRMLDLKDRFEEAAVNYAVTFEVSPPSWERRAGGVAKPEGGHGSVEAGEQALRLSGEITAGDEALAKQMQDWAAAHEMLLIDMTGAKRVGFVTAGLMLNALTAIHQAGTTIQIEGANELIHALFQVVGIERLARIIPRK
jgi:anti-anti-sigma regulatory factor